MLRSRYALPFAAALFAGLFGVRLLSSPELAKAEGVLFVIPMAILALRYGVRGGLVGTLTTFALFVTWVHIHPWAAEGGGTYVTRGVAFLVLGVLLGGFVDLRRGLETEVLHYYEKTLDLLATADSSGHFTRVNPAWERALGHSIETMCSRPLLSFVHPEDREATLAESRTLIAGIRDTVGFRNRFRNADGNYRWLEWSASACADGLIHAVARDVTAQHEAEEQLADNAKSLETMVAERTSELDEARKETLQRLAIAAEYSDDETFQHTERVGQVAAEIALGLDLPPAQIRVLRQAAPLHDVGKLAIPDRILLKPGKLDSDELEVMRTHAELGQRLLSGSNSPVLRMAAVIAATHHERWDGRGYPGGLSGEAIPLVGRIVAVADVFDALTHARPYKAAWPLSRAIAEIKRGSGSQFDPRIVAAFLALHHAAPEPDEPGPRVDPRRWNELVGSYG